MKNHIIDDQGLPKFARPKCAGCGSGIRRIFYREVEAPHNRVNIPGYIFCPGCNELRRNFA